jgi:hypothetical protein
LTTNFGCSQTRNQRQCECKSFTRASSTLTKNITTSAGANTGTVSGAVTLTTVAGNINLGGDIVTTGGSRSVASSGTASAGAQVDVTANGGTITVANITTSGGAHTGAAAGDNGGNAAAINLTSTGTTKDITLNAGLTALGGTAASLGTAGTASTVTLTATGAVGDNSAAGSVLADKLLVSAANSSILNKACCRWPSR